MNFTLPGVYNERIIHDRPVKKPGFKKMTNFKYLQCQLQFFQCPFSRHEVGSLSGIIFSLPRNHFALYLYQPVTRRIMNSLSQNCRGEGHKILTRKIYLYCKWEGSDLGSGTDTVRVRGEAGHFWKTHQFILMLDNIKIFSQMLWRDLNTLRALSLKLN